MMNETWLSHLDEQKRGLAKLLAKEDLTVRHANVKTAMFDIPSRTLILPMWRGISVDQYDLLIGHEVGHALYSDDIEGLKDCKGKPGLHSYINILEDVRIEKRIKNEFPGLRACFTRGYQDFFDNGPLFQLKKSPREYGFIDRVNLHYKIGHCVPVPFTAAERETLKRIDTCQTMQDVVRLAKELWQYAKDHKQEMPQDEKPEPKKQKQQKSDEQQEAEAGDSEESEESGEASDDSSDDSDDSSEGESDETEKSDDAKSDDSSDESEDGAGDDESEAEGSASGDESEDDEQSDSAPASGDADDDDAESESEPSVDAPEDAGKGEENPTAETDAQNAEALETLAENNQSIEYPQQVMLAPIPDVILKDRIHTSADIVAAAESYFRYNTDAKKATTAYLNDFMGTWKTTIDHMAREFERRKTAKMQERARTSRTGRLDMGKLHAYKFREDLFKTVTVVPGGKNHGLVLLIDGSSSMASVMPNVLEQVLLFASFARKVNIPVQAYLFQNCKGRATNNPQIGENMIAPSNCELLTLCDTTASNWKTQQLVLAGYAAAFTPKNGWSTKVNMPFIGLNQTPLDSGLLLVERMVARLKKALRLDKMTLLVLTDGDDNQKIYTTKSVTDGVSWKKTVEFVAHGAFVARDTVTRKVYMNAEQLVGNRFQEVKHMRHFMLVDSIRERHDCRVVRIHVAKHGEMNLTGSPYQDKDLTAKFFNQSIRPNVNSYDVQQKMDVAMKNMTEGMFEVKGDIGVSYDAMIAIQNTALDLKEDNFEDKDVTKMSDARIAAAFTKSNVTANRNRIFVNTVVPYLA